MIKLFLILILIPFIGISQNNYHYTYENHAEFDYLKRTDSITQKIFKSTNLHIQSPDFQYLTDSTIYKMDNSITTNYGFNSKVKFIFEDDNLSYLTEERFDKFRRGFYQEKDLIILLSVNKKNALKKHLETIKYNDLNIGILNTPNFISAVYFDKKTERFLQFYYFMKDKNLLKIEVKELNSTFSWDITNNSNFYFKDKKLIFKSFSQSLINGIFSLETKYDEEILLNLANEILREVLNTN